MINLKSTPIKVAAVALPLTLAGGAFLLINNQEEAPPVASEQPNTAREAQSAPIDPADLGGVPSGKPSEASNETEPLTPTPPTQEVGPGLEVSTPVPVSPAPPRTKDTPVILPDGSAAPAPGVEVITDPGAVPPGGSISPKPDITPPTTVLEYPSEVQYNNIKLDDACLIPALTLSDNMPKVEVDGVKGKKWPYLFSAKSMVNGQCSYLGLPVDKNEPVLPGTKLEEGTPEYEEYLKANSGYNHPNYAEFVINYLPAKAKYLDFYTKEAPKLEGVGDRAYISEIATSATIVAYKGDYAVLATLTGYSPEHTPEARLKVMKIAIEEGLERINELKPAPLGYFESHPDETPSLEVPPTDTVVITPHEPIPNGIDLTKEVESGKDTANSGEEGKKEGNFFTKALANIGNFFSGLFD